MSAENANDGIRLFAKGAITTAVTLNAGAILAILSQTSSILELGVQYAMAVAVKTWVVGLGLAVASWVFAFFAASTHANGYRALEQVTTWAAIISVVLSFVAVVGGANHLADALIATTIIEGR